jgi:hypothetical protein
MTNRKIVLASGGGPAAFDGTDVGDFQARGLDELTKINHLGGPMRAPGLEADRACHIAPCIQKQSGRPFRRPDAFR